jgi:outer membrane protein assembly factor BamD (BamD/ComL family)
LPTEQADNAMALQFRSVVPHSIEFYLQQLPTTAEALAESNRITEKNLFEVGNIAKNRLGDIGFAIQTYKRLLNDFPDSEYAERVRGTLEYLNVPD